jgi:hypothetical protein
MPKAPQIQNIKFQLVGVQVSFHAESLPTVNCSKLYGKETFNE